MAAWDDDGEDLDGELERLFHALEWARWRFEIMAACGFAGLRSQVPIAGWWPGRPQLTDVEVMAIRLEIGREALIRAHEALVLWEATTWRA